MADPQRKLTPGQVSTIREMYYTIFMKRGAKDIEIKSESRIGAGSVETSKKVDLIYFENDAGGWSSLLEDGGIHIVDGELGFVGGLVTITPERREEFKRNYADLPEALAGKRVVVTGYAAVSNCASARSRDLAQGRAETVAEILTEMGVDRSSMEVVGSVVPLLDECADGVVTESEREQNRKVIITTKG